MNDRREPGIVDSARGIARSVATRMRPWIAVLIGVALGMLFSRMAAADNNPLAINCSSRAQLQVVPCEARPLLPHATNTTGASGPKAVIRERAGGRPGKLLLTP